MRNLFIGIVLAVVAASAQDLRTAAKLYDQTDYRGVLRVLDAEKSNQPEVLALAGKAAFMLADFKRSTAFFEKTVRVAPLVSSYYHWLGKSYGRRAETSSFLTAPKFAVECRKAFERALELDPKNLEAWNDLFEYYMEAPGFLGGGLDKAATAAEQISKLDPVERHFAAARLAEKRKELSSAEQHLRRASELAPQQVGRVLDLAKFFARHGRVKESDSELARAETIAPGDPKVLFGRAQVYVETKRNLDEAKRLLERYLQSERLTPDDPSKDEARRLLKIASGA